MKRNLLIKEGIKSIISKYPLNESLLVKDYNVIRNKLIDFFTQAIKNGHIISYHRDLTSGDMNPKDFVEDFSDKVLQMIQKQVLNINVRGDRNIKENFYDIAKEIGKEKNDWINLTGNPTIEKKAKNDSGLRKNLFDLINLSYRQSLNKPHRNVRNEDDIFSKGYDYWEAINIDEFPDADAVLFGKQRLGIKISGIGHDGQPISKSVILKHIISILGKKYYWVEASDKLGKILLARNVRRIEDPELIKKIFPKSNIIKWFDDNSYIRSLPEGGQTNREYLFGYPNI